MRGDTLKTVKKLLPVLAILLVVVVFVYSLISEKSGEAKVVGFACGSEVTVSASGSFDSENKAQKALNEAQRLDRDILSDTLASSATYKLNELGYYTDDSLELVAYINECSELVSKCPQMTLLSKPFIDEWGITNSPKVPSPEEVKKTVSKANMSNLKIAGNKIELLNGALLSFGAFGKGTVCQKAIDVLKEENIKSAIVTVGGTVGVINSKSNTTLVGIRNPFGATGEYFATVEVNNGFLSTSGDYEKFFIQDGTKYCHIFDAQTGYPVNSDITSVTVITNGGTNSDFLSTAIFILGENGFDLATEFNSQVIIVKKDKSVIASSSLEGALNITNSEFTVTYR